MSAPEGDGHTEDQELDPAVEPKSSRIWLNLIRDAEKAFEEYQLKADNIDKLYADLGRLASAGRDREFQMFWANVEVLKPTIYARPPVPVVVPRFKDRRPLYRVSSELLERCCVTAFDQIGIDAIMLLVRDDLAIVDRGQAWARYEDKGGEKVCIEHLDRTDFLHELARDWTEVGWVARRGWMTKKEMRKRFARTSGKAYQEAAYEVRREDKERGAADGRAKCGVWEIWSKTENKVVWVTEGVDVLLDEDEPHLKLEGFFPCPRPAYGTLQRRSLVPVPTMLFYKDQLEEVNELTARIHALADAVKVRGFYPAGAGEIGDAIEAAVKSIDNRKVLIPISNWAAFGGGSAKDVIVWLPIDMISEVLKSLVELRRQIIEDVYQITGLSDIMRGETDANETATAQQIKTQYGSIRIRDRQGELVRFARDLVRITAEIMAENFSPKTLLEMSQLQLPTDAEQRKQADEITARASQEFEGQLQQAMQNPEIVQAAQQNPEQAEQMADQLRQQIMTKANAEIEKLAQKPTVEQVTKFIRDSRIRPFVLDIETDSTIQPDEQAEKAARGEFLTALASAMQQLGPLVAAEPKAARFAAEVLKFSVAPFRAGRELDAAIEEFAEDMIQKSQQPQPNPEAEAMKAQLEADLQKHQADLQTKQAEAQQKAQIEAARLQQDGEFKAAELQLRQQELAMTDQREREKMDREDMRAREQAVHDVQMQREGFQVQREEGAANRQASAAEAEASRSAAKDEAEAGRTFEADKTGVLRSTGIEQRMSEHEAVVAQVADTTAQIAQALPQIAEGLAQINQGVAALTEHVMAPAEIVRGPDGKPAAVRKGSVTSMITRNDAGQVVGLQ